MSETQIANFILEKVWNYSSENKDAVEYEESNARFRGKRKHISLMRLASNPAVFSPERIDAEGAQSSRVEQLSANKVGSPYNFNQEHKSRMSVQIEAIPSATLNLKVLSS